MKMLRFCRHLTLSKQRHLAMKIVYKTDTSSLTDPALTDCQCLQPKSQRTPALLKKRVLLWFLTIA